MPNPLNQTLNPDQCTRKKDSEASAMARAAQAGPTNLLVSKLNQTIKEARQNISIRDVDTFIGRIAKVFYPSESRIHLKNNRPELAGLTDAQCDEWPPCIKIIAPKAQSCFERPTELWTSSTSDLNKLFIELDPLIFAPMYSNSGMMSSPAVGGFVEVGFINKNGMKSPVYYRLVEAAEQVTIPTGGSTPDGQSRTENNYSGDEDPTTSGVKVENTSTLTQTSAPAQTETP